MYYVLQVASGREADAADYIRQMIPTEVCAECFFPVRQIRKKIRGKWIDYKERLLPGYIFIRSNDIAGFYKHIPGSPMWVKILGKEIAGPADISFYPLTENEEDWLLTLCGLCRSMASSKGKNHDLTDYVIALSQVKFNENDEVVIVSGPLKDLKGWIKKIHLHKRVAEVEVEFMKSKISVYLGIELLEAVN